MRDGALVHMGFVYAAETEYVDHVLAFIEAGLDQGEPVIMFAPESKLDLVRHRLPSTASDVTMLDARELGRNPARIIPGSRRFADSHPGRRVRIVGEGIWPGRSEDELDEFVRHEALVNVLFADVAATILCPYDAEALAASSIEHAWETHSDVIDHGTCVRSATFVDPLTMLSRSTPLAAPPPDAATITFGHGDVRMLRWFVRDLADRFGLLGERAANLILAVSEAASNTLIHTEHGGTLRAWRDDGSVVCEISDRGHLVLAHLVGRIEPPSGVASGRGVWLIHQLCDLVQIRSDVTGTSVRMRMDIG